MEGIVGTLFVGIAERCLVLDHRLFFFGLRVAFVAADSRVSSPSLTLTHIRGAFDWLENLVDQLGLKGPSHFPNRL